MRLRQTRRVEVRYFARGPALQRLTGEQYLPRCSKEALAGGGVRAGPASVQPARAALIPGLESVLARALAKGPDDQARVDGRLPRHFVRPSKPTWGKKPRQRPANWTPPGLFPRSPLGSTSTGSSTGLSRGPPRSVNYGGAGIAYLFYRASCLLDRPDLLAWADDWIEHAKRALENLAIGGLLRSGSRLEPNTVGRTALYHSGVGVHSSTASWHVYRTIASGLSRDRDDSSPRRKPQ